MLCISSHDINTNFYFVIALHEDSANFRPKKPKRTPSEDRRLNNTNASSPSSSPPSPTPSDTTSSSTTTTTTTGYIQGMSLIINNSDSQHDLTGRITNQSVTESTEIPGAIAIPIQVGKCFFSNSKSES